MFLFLGNSSLTASAASPFKDVKTTHWAYSSIEWAFQKGLIKGYADGTFQPERPVTESQFVAMLIRYDCSSQNGFPAKVGEHSASGNYRYLINKHIPLNGYTNASLRDKPITRGQVAKVITAFNGLDLSTPHAAQYLYMQNLSSGQTGKRDYADFGVDRPMTRAQVTAFFQRLSKQGSCQMKGLKQKATGKDDVQIPLPLHFMGEETVKFPDPEKEKPSSPPSKLSNVEIKVEKPSLIANGVDSTFIHLTLKDCNGREIPYEQNHLFNVTSRNGAMIKDEDNDYDKVGLGYQLSGSSSTETDGPDLSVEVVAPKTSKEVTDKISFQVANGAANMACYKTPIDVNLTYAPQAEVRIEVDYETSKLSPKVLPMNQSAWVRATIVRPGGQTAYNFNGRIAFRSSKGASLGSSEVSVVNGVASTYLYPLSSESLVDDTITAEIVQMDSRYENELSSLVNKRYVFEVAYEPSLTINNACNREETEVAVVIDSSGSMKQNDPERLRVSKSKAFIRTLNATQNIATHFNSQGYLLDTGLPYPVSNRLNGVRQSGGTNIAQGLEKAFTHFTGNQKKVAILLTDGKSNEVKVLQMIDRAKREGITIYPIGLGKKQQLNEALLEKIAYETGGHYYHIEQNIHIGSAYQSILDRINCGTPPNSCLLPSYVFDTPVLEKKNNHVYMNTSINSSICGEVERVVVRFRSIDGDVDYELVYRGQDYFALKKEIAEIKGYTFYTEAVFLAFNAEGQKVGERTVVETLHVY